MKKILGIITALVLLATIAFAAGSFWLYRSLNLPIAHDKAGQYIVIEKGSTPKEIISKLEGEGIISAGTATEIYIRTLGDPTKLQAGEYQFDSPISPLQVLKELERGEDQTIKLTIPEGFTRFDIAKRIVEKFPQETPITEAQILLLMEDTSSIGDLAPEAKNLEGYMYPSTYSFPRGTKPDAVIKRLVDQFRTTWKPEWTEEAKKINRTPHEIVTIASLIETESHFPNERPVVASVIYNRLSKGIPLGIDQTSVYVAKMQNRWDGEINKSDLEADSPYNTRRYGGIPPGPISSVTESSIKAALEPASTNYIYYVRNVQTNDGSHHFYSSAAEFEKGKAEYQKWLEDERRKLREKEAADNSNK